MWVDVEYYANGYLLGRSPLIPLPEFTFWERQAYVAINVNKVEIEDVPEALKQCACEVAELLYTQDKATGIDRVKTFSNDGYSISYASDGKSPAEMAKTIRGIVSMHLSGTDLHNDFVYAGVK